MSEAQPEGTPTPAAETADAPAEAPALTETQPDATAEDAAVQTAPPATPVLQQIPSNQDAPAEPDVVEDAPKSTVEEAAAALLELVDEGHKIGDRLLDAARDELRAILGAE